MTEQWIRPYGDTKDDGKIQLSFTLPVPPGAKAREAALELLRMQGFVDPQVTEMADLTTGYTFFVCYAATPHRLDFNRIEVSEVDLPALSMDEIDERIEKTWGRPLVVVGACIGTDAHTVGIDAIMNMKGFNGHYGLERYRMFKAINLGAQVPPDVLVARAVAENADAILVSQVVTQKNLHLAQLTQLIDLVEAENLRRRFVMIVGGPRITHELATELGYDVGMGPGNYAEDVATYLINNLSR